MVTSGHLGSVVGPTCQALYCKQTLCYADITVLLLIYTRSGKKVNYECTFNFEMLQLNCVPVYFQFLSSRVPGMTLTWIWHKHGYPPPLYVVDIKLLIRSKMK